jgi:hypothetical protein
MDLSKLSPNVRFAIAVGASIGVGQVLLRAFSANLGPIVGFMAGIVATAALAATISWVLERAVKRAQTPEAANG